MGGAAHDALHDERRTRCNHPIVDVSADEVAAVDTADYCGAGMAVPAVPQRHACRVGRLRGCVRTHESSLASYCT